MTLARAFLACQLADVELLACDRNTLNSRVFERAYEARWMYEAGRRIKTANLVPVVPADMEQRLVRLRHSVNADVPTLLAAELLEREPGEQDGLRLDWFPEFSPESVVTDGEELPPILDAHLHSGAAISFSDMVRLLVSGERAASFAECHSASRTQDNRAGGFVPTYLLQGVRHYLQHLGNESSVTSGEFEVELSQGHYWDIVQRACATPGPFPREPSPDMLRLLVNHGGVDPARTFAELYRRIARFDLDAVRCIVALVLASYSVRSKHGEGLPIFVDRFSQMGFMRDSSLSGTRSEIVTEACRRALSPANVVGVEFRKSLTASPGGTRGRMRDAFVDHLRGFARFAETGRRPSRLAMPFTYVRAPAMTAPRAGLRTLYDLPAIMEVHSAMVDLVERTETLRHFVSAVDVVGDELEVPNWPYVPILADWGDVLSRNPGLVLQRTAHAGEFFRWRLQGLRSVGELLVPNQVVDRVGHALALGDVDSFARRTGTVTFRDILEDVLWLDACGWVNDEAEQWALECLKASGVSDVLGVGLSQFREAWIRRRSFAGLRDSGLVGRDWYASSDFMDLERPDYALMREPDGVIAALMCLVYRGGSGLELLDLEAPRDIAKRYIEWQASVCHAVSKKLRLFCADEHIVVEACPTSNFLLGGLDSIDQHPLSQFVSEGMIVTLNTDDPIIFGTNIAREYRIAYEAFGAVVAKGMASNSVNYGCRGAPVWDRDEAVRVMAALRDELGVLEY